MGDTWRERFTPHIAKVIAEFDQEHRGLPSDQRLKQLRKLLVCPAGLRAYWPGKVWRDEVNTQLGIKAQRQARKQLARDRAAGQTELF